MPVDIPMTKENKLDILKRAREILSDPRRWGRGRLKKQTVISSEPQYCVLGACEQAVYDLGLVEQTEESFGVYSLNASPVDAYLLGRDLSLYSYAKRVFGNSPDSINDFEGYERMIEMLDGYIAEVAEDGVKFAKITHIRCSEDDGTTYGFVPDDWTEDQFHEAVGRAKKAYQEATSAYLEEIKQGDLQVLLNYWGGTGTPDYGRYPDKTVREIKELHAKEVKEKKRRKAVLDEARRTFGSFLAKEGFVQVYAADAEFEIDIDWGHQHGIPLKYQDAWPGDVDKKGAGWTEEEED